MARNCIDCREFPSDTNCSVSMVADSEQKGWKWRSSMRRASTCITTRRDQNTHILFASSRNCPRKSGWAIAISSCARCLADLPRSWATPNSVTT